jgi:hypothetical protein
MPSFLINHENIKDPEKVADVFNSFSLSAAENLNLYQVEKEDAILKKSVSLQIPWY